MVYTVDEVAKLLRVSIKTAKAYLRQGQLRGRKVGKRWLVHEEAIKAFLFAPTGRLPNGQ